MTQKQRLQELVRQNRDAVEMAIINTTVSAFTAHTMDGLVEFARLARRVTVARINDKAPRVSDRDLAVWLPQIPAGSWSADDSRLFVDIHEALTQYRND